MEILVSYRQRAGLKQVEFAKRLGVSKATLCRWEKGVRQITPEQAVSIERKTGGKLSRYALRPDLFGEIRSDLAGVSSG